MLWKFIGTVFFAVMFAAAAWPAWNLWKIVWNDRKLPGTHGDYARLYWGKKMVPISAGLCSLVAAGCLWAIRWCLR